ncbi:glycoside hydrolase [Streptomyces armeniacus]|uniref:Glycoside hydrolase n=1 Tax=Streptomyces armeniacus TaxID=83291 RepID=A0A345Y155_9ACTN|nr:glycoside hydrolase [Streptomyces armeniacus]
MAVACVLGVLAGPLAGSAYADPPAPDPQPSASGPGGSGGSDGSGGSGASGEKSLEQVRKEIEDLHSKAESAAEEYNAAEEKAKQQRKNVSALNRKISANKGKMDALKNRAGAMARAQYRGGGMPDEAQLILANSPAEFMRQAGLVRKGQQATRGFLGKLTDTGNRLDGYAAEAADQWQRLESNRKKKAKAKKTVEDRLKKAEKLRSQLEKDELKELAELEKRAADARQARWLESGVLEEIRGKASKAGKRALAYATDQVGKDYEWGAEGPKTFDCSGLTMRAWQAAGETPPRTSQQQWKSLPKVPIKEMRPGDLIIYKKDASHVGMYVGDGSMVHAPRTGRQITVEGAGSMPILGVVRPDGDAAADGG